MDSGGFMKRFGFLALAGALMLAACGGHEDRVGGFSNDLLGNQIVVEALTDPGLPNVVCHVSYFNRSVLDRLGQGNWFENPSNSSVSCQRTGPIDVSRVPLGRGGQEIFSQNQSPFFKKTGLRRIVDLEHRSVLYVSYARELVEGSAKMDMSSVLLTEDEAAAAQHLPAAH
jgi:CreA protein